MWQQRQRAADLLAVASKYPTFPMLLEATRECVNDVFDVPALVDVLAGVRDRRIRTVSVETPTASPMAESLLFGWIAVYMYEGDAPLAERRAAALALDRDLLRDLLGDDELRSLVDPAVLDQVEAELQRTTDGRRARDVDEVHDLLRVLGPLSIDEVAARCEPAVGDVAGRVGEARGRASGDRGVVGGRRPVRRRSRRGTPARRARRGHPAGAAAVVHRPGRHAVA